MSDVLTDFERGVLYAVAVVQVAANETGIAADILRESGLTDLNCAELDECDKAALRRVNQESGISLRGLE